MLPVPLATRKAMLRAIACTLLGCLLLAGSLFLFAPRQDGRAVLRPPAATASAAATSAPDHSPVTRCAKPLEEDSPRTTPAISKRESPPVVAWAATYNDPASGGDFGHAVAVDGKGNVYVAGESQAQRSGESQYVVVKYDANGTQLWLNRYDSGPGAGSDVALRIVVQDGYVYVDGVSEGNGLIKYDQHGNLLWSARASGVLGGLAVDGAGNVYATGYPRATKYDKEGTALWAITELMPKAIAYDSTCNVFVTGFVQRRSIDYATAKYDSTGKQMWLRSRPALLSYGDSGVAIVVDNDGSVYTTGPSMGRTPGLYPFDYLTVKYDREGNEKWANRYDGTLGNMKEPTADNPAPPTEPVPNSRTAGADTPIGIGLDREGNILVTGSSWPRQTFADYATLKYDNAGNFIWAARYNGPTNGEDRPEAMVVDREGNIYVTGRSGTVAATVKYDTDGKLIWVAEYAGPEGTSASSAAIGLDGEGNVYVTGSTVVTGHGYDLFVVKYVKQPN